MRGSDDFVDHFVGGAPPGFVDLERLSGGSEGDVYRATEAATGIAVVLKPVRNRGAGARAFEVLRRAASAHLPELRGFVEIGRVAFLVLRWVPGGPLAPGPIELPRACREAAAVADALAALHEAGLHHGDLSPGNVLSTDDGGVWVVDLALLGRRGTGTPGFIAPEVLQAGGGAAADLFSLGCLLCWRLFGEVPWVLPRELLGGDPVRDLAPFLARRPLPRPLVRLLERLLTADPDARVPRGRALVAVLENLARQHEARVHAPDRTRYRLPSRWPYVGPELASVVAACRSARPPRLVVVFGPCGVGRGRIVEELMLGLQQGGGSVQRMAPGAWRTLPRTAPPTVFAFVDGLDLAARQREAWLLAQAQQPGPTLLVTSEAPLPGWAMSSHEGAAVLQLRVERWDVATVRTVAACALETPSLERWAEVLVDLTGGWPARVLTAIEACARAGVDDAARVTVERAVAAHAATEGTLLDEATAHRILALRWRPTTPTSAGALPAELRGHDGRPHTAAVLAARSRLGEHRVRRLARRILRRAGEPSLALALDADDPRSVHCSATFVGTSHLNRPESVHHGATISAPGEDASPNVHRSATSSSDSDSEALIAWVERRTGVASDELRRWTARYLLGVGHGERASRVLHGLADPASRFLQARALHRLGDRDGALAVVLALGGTRLEDAAIGLKWRIWAEQGEAAAAVAEAAKHQTSASSGWAAAAAHVGAGFAAWVAGDVEQAQSWLETALTCVSGREHHDRPDGAVEVEAVRARALQLLGNLSHHRGDLHAALRWHRDAAEAFAAAGEPIGEISIRANLAALALPLARLADGIEHGRHAVTAMVARGHVDGLTAAGANLVQLLVQSEALTEAQAVETLLTAFLPHPRAPIDDVRLERIRLERIRAEASGAARLSVAVALEACAARFEAVGSPREAMDTWLLAAAIEREEGHVTGSALAAAARLAEGLGDAVLDLRLRVEALRRASDVGILGDVELTTRRVLEHPLTPRLRSLGHVALAQDVHHALGDIRRRASTLTSSVTHEKSLQEDEMKLVRPGSPDPSPSPGQPPLGELDPSITTMQALLTGEPRVPQPEATSVASRDRDSLRWARLIRVYRRLATETALEPLLQQVIDSVLELTGGERGVVAVLREDGTRLEVTRDLGGGERQLEFSQSIVRQVLSSGEAILSIDAASDDRFDSAHSISHLNLRSVIAAPLRFRGERLGALYIDHRLRRGQFDESDLEQVEAFADLAASAVAHARALEAMQGQANTLRGQTQRLEQQRQELAQRLEARDTEVLTLREAVRARVTPVYRGLVGSSHAMARVCRLIDRLADSPAPVVVYGESGTGKELVARAIHDAGSRAAQPFVAENCAAIPESLLESILFGHAKGSFSGAHRDQPGLFEAADSGTLFLDEIGEMSPSMQAKLLRVLQESEVRRIGETRPRRIDVRIIAASNRDLKQMVDAGTFRADLYYRVNVVRLELPPLRERSEDIVPLVEHFWQMHAKGRPLRLSPEVRRRLLGYAWPGNVREIANEVQRWVALSDDVVEVADLSAALAEHGSGRGLRAGFDPHDLQLRPRVEQLERELIERALERTGGNQTQAAVLLGLSRFGLQKKLKRLEET